MKVLKFFGFAAACLLTFSPVLLLANALRRARSAKLRRTSDAAGPVPDQNQELPGSSYDQIIEIWKKAVDVQQHFNGLELQIRNFAVTLLVAILGGTAFALKEHYTVAVFGATFSLAVAICLAGVPGLFGFYFMDRHWYHKLLIGSVNQTVAIERSVKAKVPALGLSEAIGHESPVTWGPFEIHSSEKIDIFYSVGLFILVLLAWVLLFAGDSGGIPTNGQTPTAPGSSESTLIQNYVTTECNSGIRSARPKKKGTAPCQVQRSQ
jgi:hypothetical protein